MNNEITKNNPLYNFFMSKWYPPVVVLIVLAGHFMGYEMYFAMLNVALGVTALYLCDSIRPLYTVVITFTCILTYEHSPYSPVNSDYYFTGWRMTAIIAMGAVVLVALLHFIIRNRVLSKISFKKTRLLIPVLVLSLAFLLNGVGSENWTTNSLIFGATQLIIYLFVFFLFYLGLSEKDGEEDLIDYITYIALIVSWMLIIQIAYQFIFDGALEGGTINRGKLNLGWVNSNPLGGILVTFIPTLFYGAMQKKHGWLYFITAGLMYIAAVVTMSRNALVFGTLTFGVCFIIACFMAKNGRRRYFIGALVLCGLALLAAFTVFYDKIALIFNRYVTSGMGDSGRFNIWKKAWNIFLEHKIFGDGFFTTHAEGIHPTVDIMPTMAHNTVLELLSSMGLVGLMAYSYYRIDTIRIILRRPTLAKFMLGMSTLVIAAQSLLDSYIFFYYPMFFPMAALAVICRIYDLQMEREANFFKEIRDKITTDNLHPDEEKELSENTEPSDGSVEEVEANEGAAETITEPKEDAENVDVAEPDSTENTHDEFCEE